MAGLFDQWNQALQSGDVAKVVSLYSADAVLQPTVSNRVRASSAEIRDYFEHFLALKPVGEINYREIRRLGPTTALDSGVVVCDLAGECQVLADHGALSSEQRVALLALSDSDAPQAQCLLIDKGGLQLVIRLSLIHI